MKKTFFMTLAVTVLIFALGTGSAFAECRNCFSRANLPQTKSDRPAQNRKISSQRGMKRFPGGMNRMDFAKKGKNLTKKTDLLGTVSAVSPDKETMSVKDADGNESQIHINPLTRIKVISAQASRAEKKSATEKQTFSDVKVGDWVMIDKLGGETKTLEAGKITVVKE
ncbi:MAG: hypothetical protein IJ257_00255 [Treponema sp.]|nr:hypothetical protein [Treponema sp.]